MKINDQQTERDARTSPRSSRISELARMLSPASNEEAEALRRRAYEVKTEKVGRVVRLRGIIEFANVCSRDCLYCGIRKSNGKVERYRISKEEILKSAEWIHASGYGSLVLQSGERSDPEFVDFVEDVLRSMKMIGDGALGITLSVGEQTKETYERWFEAGAHRYLLRIETSNPKLYAAIHPPDSVFERRVECLTLLKECGYQVGTGVMIGLPDQTPDDLAADILFFEEMDIDMIGMGPFIPHADTPFAEFAENFDPQAQLEKALNMIAVTRITLEDVNIAAATALQALNPLGREMGLKAGANVIMPNTTDVKYRAAYQLYDDKPCLDENSDQCKLCLEGRIKSCGETIAYNEWGDSPHFLKRKGDKRGERPRIEKNER